MCKGKFLYNCSWSIGLYFMHAENYLYYFTQLRADESIIYIIHHKYRKTLSEWYACQFLWAFHCTLNFGSCFGARVDFWRRRRWGCSSMQLKWGISWIFLFYFPFLTSVHLCLMFFAVFLKSGHLHKDFVAHLAMEELLSVL